MPDPDLTSLSAEQLLDRYLETLSARQAEELRAELLRRLRLCEQQALALEGWAEVAGRRVNAAPPPP
jgi:hypothetical protein